MRHRSAGQEGETASADAFNIPDNVTLLGTTDPNVRKASATVNGALITRTDVDQRVALILAENNAKDVPEDELKRLRLQVLRNLIDETLQIQEAKAQEMAVTQDEVDEAYARVAAEQLQPRHSGNGSLPALGRLVAELGQAADRRPDGVGPAAAAQRHAVRQRLERRGQRALRARDRRPRAPPNTASARSTSRPTRPTAPRWPRTPSGSSSSCARARASSPTRGSSPNRRPRRRAATSAGSASSSCRTRSSKRSCREMSPGQLAGPIDIPGGFDILFLIDKRQIGMADPRDAVLSLKQISIDFPKGMPEAEARQRPTG